MNRKPQSPDLFYRIGGVIGCCLLAGAATIAVMFWWSMVALSIRYWFGP